MKKRLMIIIPIILLIILLVSANYIKNNNNKVVNILVNNKFKKENNINYQKLLSKSSLKDYNNNLKDKKDDYYDLLSFNLNNYTLDKTYSYLNKDEKAIYNFRYDFRKKEIVYKVTFTYDNYNAILLGTYKNDDNNSCNIDFSFNKDDKKLEKKLCDKALIENKNFLIQIDDYFNEEDKQIIIEKQKNLK